MHTANHRAVLERIQEVNDLLNSFIIKQAIPHLGASSGLINNENSNHRIQLGWALHLYFSGKLK